MNLDDNDDHGAVANMCSTIALIGQPALWIRRYHERPRREAYEIERDRW